MGSLFAALTTAVSGLDAQSAAIGNISENLANAQTTGYKAVGTEFEELVNASSATVNNPGGVTATPQYENDVQGSIVSSDTSTSMAISGQGFFQVESGTENSSGNLTNGTTYYTRQGDFTLDQYGYVVNGSGYYLMGYTLGSNGALDTSTTNPIQLSDLLNDPVAASQIAYSANLPATAAVGYTSAESSLQIYDAQGAPHTVDYSWTNTGTNTWNLNVSIPDATDSNGNVYNATIPYTFNSGSGSESSGTIESMTAYQASTPSFSTSATPPTGSLTIGNVSIPLNGIATGSATSVDVTLTASDGTTSTESIALSGLTSGASSADGYASNIIKAFNEIAGSTQISSSYGISGMRASAGSSADYVDLSASSQNITANSGGTAGQITWVTAGTNGDGAGADGSTQEIFSSPYGTPTAQSSGDNANLTIDPVFGTGGNATTQPMTLTFGTFGGSSGVTQFYDSNETVSVSNFSQNGLPQGSFDSVSIASNGDVSINYSNGTNKIIAQIPIAQFYAQDQLQQITGGAYATTLESGNARLTTPGNNGSGTISSSSLEESNVDISTEFTNLIQAQQVYSANAKLVTTDDNMLQVTLNMIQ